MSIRDEVNWMLRDQIIIDFLEACKEAAIDSEKFKVFKQDSRITHVFEHASRRLGENYLKLINEQSPNLLDVSSFLENDLLGSPRIDKFFLEKSYRYSSTTLQYIGVLSNLLTHFKSLDDFKIIEIGGGYGGQCKIIQDYCKIFSYDIIDLPEVGLLQKKYLTELGCCRDVEIFSDIGLAAINYDLVISNYALTEVLDPLQTEYVIEILLKSKHGYITCNGPINKIMYLQNKFPNLTRINDIEGESENNYILIW